MANTLTGLIPTIYQALDVVAREQTGAIMAAAIDANANAAAVGQTIRSPIAPASTSASITPGATVPNTGGQTITYADLVITKSKAVPIQWTGEEQLSVGTLENRILLDQFAQAFRTLSNEVDADLCAEAATVTTSGQLVGTAGTTPFGTAGDLSDFAAMAKVLDVNGAPVSGRHFVGNFAAKANLYGKHSELFKVNEAGTDELLRRGIVAELMGFGLHFSNNPALVDTTTDYRANFAVRKGALQLLARTPAMPTGGDGAADVTVVVDPVSGLPFQIAVYRVYRQIHIEVGLAWGVKLIKPEFVAILRGEST